MKNKIFATLLVLCVSLFILSCQLDMTGNESDLELENGRVDDTGIAPKIIKDTGVIRYINLEGGFYGIIGRNGKYDPVNLPRIFMQDGLRVEFTAVVLEDMASFHMWGQLIRLVSIVSVGNEKKLIMDEGVVHQYTIQGNPWVIKATTGTYQALNLPEEFAVENLKVRFVGVIRDDIIIIPPLWPLLEILEIKKIGGGPLIIDLGKRFKLPEGESALEPDADILFTFKEVLQDSRCPEGAYCFWEGEAVILVNVKIGNRDYGDFKMTTRDRPSIIYVGRYSVQFIDLDPYPVLDPPTNEKIDYVGYFLIDYAYGISTPPPMIQ